MSRDEKQAEQKILNAARSVFQRSGLSGARMQQIADEAGINKAALHYYFRSKEKLFQSVFQEDFERFMIPLSSILFRDTELTVEERITTFVKAFIRTLIENPHLPLFVIHEISRSPDRLLMLVDGRTDATPGEGDDQDVQSRNKQYTDVFIRQIREGIEEGKYNEVVPEQYIISLVGMCVYPFIARPIIRHWLNQDDEQYRAFLEERQEEVIDYAFRILMKDHPIQDNKRSQQKNRKP